MSSKEGRDEALLVKNELFYLSNSSNKMEHFSYNDEWASMCMCVRACVCACMCVCVHVCS